MTFSYLDGWWTDAGTFESLLRAANLVAQTDARKNVSSGEVVALA
jgi:glucose-1-phosphate thymidylyltransferase